MAYFYKIIVLFLFFSLLGCNADEEPCERFPREYQYTLVESDFGPVNLYEYEGGEFVESSNSARDRYDVLRDGETIVGVLGSYISTMTITSDTTVDVHIKTRDQEETLSFSLLPYDPGYYYVLGDRNTGVVTLAGVSDDCMTINLCYYIATHLSDVRIGLDRLEFCYEHSDAILAAEIGQDSRLKEGDELLVLQFNQDFVLQ